jgi:prepilin-type N-terminal cleavage/methylation domain-containing protein
MKKINNTNTKKQSGFAMIEMLIALGVAAIVISFAYVVFSYAMNKIHESRAISQISTIEEGVQELYANSHNFGDITTKTIIDGGIADKGDIISETTIGSPWYGKDSTSIVTIAPASNPGAFTVTLASVPTYSCAKVAAAFLSNNLSVSGKVVTTPASLTSACASADKADIEVTF